MQGRLQVQKILHMDIKFHRLSKWWLGFSDMFKTIRPMVYINFGPETNLIYSECLEKFVSFLIVQ
jgi:hypothetical protein